MFFGVQDQALNMDGANAASKKGLGTQKWAVGKVGAEKVEDKSPLHWM